MMRFCIVLLCSYLIGCSNDIAEVDALTQSFDVNIENGRKIKMLYSDSAQLKVKITADSIVRYVEKANPRDEFPSGIYIEFLNPKGKVTSWLRADRAVRNERDDTFIARGNVRFYNKNKDKLLSTELVWNEAKSILHTDKYVTVIQGMKGDTTFGFGFTSNEDFNIFEIKKSTSAIFRSEEFKKRLSD